MIKAFVLISVLALAPSVALAQSGKALGWRADLCFDRDAPECTHIYLQNVSNAIVGRTIIRVLNDVYDEEGNHVCEKGKDEVVRTNLSRDDHFRARVDTRCDHYIRFKLNTCGGGKNTTTMRASELKTLIDDLENRAAVVLYNRCKPKVHFHKVQF